MKKCDIDIDKPIYDQNTYIGRVKYFALITNPLNIFATSQQLEDAKCLVRRCRLNKCTLPPGTTKEDLLRAKVLYDSAYHAESGQKMILLGRWSAQVPVSMIVTGGMLTFNKTKRGIIFWQWLNQWLNAIVNRSNKSGTDTASNKQIAASYILGTGGAVTTVLAFHRLFRTKPLLQRGLAPMLAISVANCINIPAMRMHELRNGTPIYDQNGDKLGSSKRASKIATLQVLVSRLCMSVPGMTSIPYFVELFDRKGIFERRPWLRVVMVMVSTGVLLLFLVPLGCALFKQNSALEYERLEPELRAQLDKKLWRRPQYVYYNKGL